MYMDWYGAVLIVIIHQIRLNDAAAYECIGIDREMGYTIMDASDHLLDGTTNHVTTSIVMIADVSFNHTIPHCDLNESLSSLFEWRCDNQFSFTASVAPRSGFTLKPVFWIGLLRQLHPFNYQFGGTIYASFGMDDVNVNIESCRLHFNGTILESSDSMHNRSHYEVVRVAPIGQSIRRSAHYVESQHRQAFESSMKWVSNRGIHLNDVKRNSMIEEDISIFLETQSKVYNRDAAALGISAGFIKAAIVEGWAPNVIKKVGEVVSNFFENFLLPLMQIAFTGPSAALSETGTNSFLEEDAFETSFMFIEDTRSSKKKSTSSSSSKSQRKEQDDRSNSPERPGTLAIFIAKDILKSSSLLVDEIAQRMCALLNLDLHSSIVDMTRQPLSEALSLSMDRSLKNVLPITLSRTVPIMIERLTPILIVRQISATITQLVTRGVVHSLVPTLIHMLQPHEHWDSLLYYAHTDAAFYADYYTDTQTPPH